MPGLPWFSKSPTNLDRLIRWGLMLGFALAIARFWSPYFGLTALIQADGATAERLPASLRYAPVFIHEKVGRYDGAFYAQIATDPTLRDPDLRRAADDLGYRGRRILLSACAWLAGGGDPVAALRAYAWLNVVLWFGLALMLMQVLPVGGGWRNAAAWIAVLFTSGVMASVRFALTDLAALLLVAGGLLLVERRRPLPASLCLGAAGLARETALLGGVMFWTGMPKTRADLLRWCQWGGLAALPLVGWWSYVHFGVVPSNAGSGNFALPLAGWLGKWAELWRLTGEESNRGLILRGWLDCAALTVQVVFLWRHRDPGDAWWRVGATFAVLGMVLGASVWEGLPGAYARVLLPVTLCFNVLVVRRRAALGWFLLGNLSLVGGVWTLLELPGTPHQLTDARAGEHRYVLETDDRWSVAEWNRKHRWAWCAGEGGLSFRMWPHRSQAKLELELRGLTPRELEVWHAGRVVWRGRIGDRPEWIALPELPATNGRLQLELRSPMPPTAEGADNTARSISFACFGARLVE